MNFRAFILLALLLVGCDAHRDLHTVAAGYLSVDCDWSQSDVSNTAAGGATAFFYRNDRLEQKIYFPNGNPNNLLAQLPEGVYKIVVVNGLVYSERETHLDDIYYRNSDDLNRFEAYAAELAVRSSSGELFVSNELDHLAGSTYWDPAARSIDSVSFDTPTIYQPKYVNGVPTNAKELPGTTVGLARPIVPMPITYRSKIVITLTNPESAYAAMGYLRGFSGSTFLASRMPSHTNVTHQFSLNHLTQVPGDPKRATIESPTFNTFGPPLDLPSRRYEFELKVLLRDGSVRDSIYDITDQIAPVVRDLRTYVELGTRIDIDIHIPVDNLELPLPQVSGTLEGGIGVDSWGPSELVPVPIRPKK